MFLKSIPSDQVTYRCRPRKKEKQNNVTKWPEMDVKNLETRGYSRWTKLCRMPHSATLTINTGDKVLIVNYYDEI